jgi:hypothetical protein
MSTLQKLAGVAALLMATALGACNLSQSGALQEVALNPPTLQASPTRTPIPFGNPTRTAVAAPTITFLGGDDSVVQPAAQVVDVAVIATQPPPQGICSAKPTGNYAVNVRLGPGADFGIVTALRAGQYAEVISRSDNHIEAPWFHIRLGGTTQGWVSPKVVTLYGPCDSLTVDVMSIAPVVSLEPSMTPTPTAMFGFTMNIPLNHLITKVNVGSIPAGTTVMVSTTQFTGSEYLYQIVTADGRYETARDSQLAYSEKGVTQLFPTPTPYVYVATPRDDFDTELYMNLYRTQTIVQVGDIPANTPVRVGSAMYNGTYWTYDISTKDEKHANAMESQLAYIPNSGGGLPPAPTPSAAFQSELGMNVFRVRTTTAVADIPANTAVRVSTAMFDGLVWTYDIATKDELHATAYEWQLAYIPGAGGGGPTPTEPPLTPTVTVPVMALPSDVSSSDVVIPSDTCTVTANSRTNLIAQPGFPLVVGVLDPGPWAQVDATDGKGWYKVTIWTDGRQGWTNLNTVTLHGSCDNLPVESGG